MVRAYHRYIGHCSRERTFLYRKGIVSQDNISYITNPSELSAQNGAARITREDYEMVTILIHSLLFLTISNSFLSMYIV